MDRLSHCSVFLCTSHAVFEFFFFFFLMIRRPPRSTLFPYTRSSDLSDMKCLQGGAHEHKESGEPGGKHCPGIDVRSEEHTSELQSLAYLVCRLLLEKKKTYHPTPGSLTNPTSTHVAARSHADACTPS